MGVSESKDVKKNDIVNTNKKDTKDSNIPVIILYDRNNNTDLPELKKLYYEVPNKMTIWELRNKLMTIMRINDNQLSCCSEFYYNVWLYATKNSQTLECVPDTNDYQQIGQVYTNHPELIIDKNGYRGLALRLCIFAV